MKLSLKCKLAALSLLLPVSCAPHTEIPKQAVADLILTNGYIYAADEDRSTYEALAIQGKEIIAIGSHEHVMAYASELTEVRDLGGKMVMPGLHDMHIHALNIVPPDMCDLNSTPYSLEDLVPVLKDCLAQYSPQPGSWLTVAQWNPYEGNEASETFPTMRSALDAVSLDQPVLLLGNDGHQGAANSAAFASASPAINVETLRTEYAEYRPFIGVDARGEPNGKLTDSGRNLIRYNRPEGEGGNSAPPVLMPLVAAKLAESGITTIQEAKADEDVLRYYAWLDEQGGMTFRVRTAIHIGGHGASFETPQHAVDHAIRLRDSISTSEFLRLDSVKLFIDGVMEGDPRSLPPTLPNAAVIDGYNQPIFHIHPDSNEVHILKYVDLDSDVCVQARVSMDDLDPDIFQSENGFLPIQCSKVFGELEGSPDMFRQLISGAVAAGFHIHAHVISDRAIRVATDIFEEVKPFADANGVTLSAAHLQLGKTVDYERLGDMGIYVVMTYIWAEPDPEYEMMVIPFIDHVHSRDELYNEEGYYAQNAYAARSLQAYGAKLVFGSDAPVGSRNPRPFESMQTALTRQKEDGTGPVLNIGEAIDIHSAIASYTRTSAEMMGHQDELGTLETGKTADLIVLDQNVIDLAESGRAADIGLTKVVTTIFNGEIIFERE